MRLAADWLVRAQAVHGRGGYAHSFSLRGGWAPPYPETTGYIVPTLLRLGDRLGADAYVDSAMAAGPWLLAIQQDDGSFVDLQGRRQIFDTGQILEGLIALHRRTGAPAYRASALAAARFIAEMQDADGTWTRHGYLGVPHSYYTRVAANLLAVDAEFGEPAAAKTAIRFLDWVLQQARPNGYVAAMEFAPGTLPYLHTIAYVLEGLESSHAATGDPALLRCLERTGDALLEAATASGFVPWAQFDAAWRPARRERCLTGIAQWCGLLIRRARHERDERFRPHIEHGLAYLMRRQLRLGGADLRGGLPGSWPVWGSYLPWSIPNWGVKFFLDALLEYDAMGAASAA